MRDRFALLVTGIYGRIANLLHVRVVIPIAYRYNLQTYERSKTWRMNVQIVKCTIKKLYARCAYKTR